MSNKFCRDCKPDCLQEIPGGCIPYTGTEIPCIDIANSNTEDSYLQDNFIKLGQAYCQFLEDNKVNLGCFFEGEDSVNQQSYVAVKKLLDWACAISSDNIPTGSNLYCLADGISVSAATLTNKTFTWQTQALPSGVNYIYNLSSVIESLPPNFTVNSVSVKANGNRVGSSRTLLASTTEATGGFQLQPDNYPVNIKTELRVGTPDGEIMLEKEVSLTGNFSTEVFTSTLDIKDFSNNKSFSSISQTQFNEFLSSAYCHLKQLYDNLRNVQLSDCEFIQYGSDTHINTVLAVHSGKICEALGRLANIGAETVSYKDCDDNCGITIRDENLQTVLDLMGTDICDALSRIRNLEARVTELELQLQNCCT